MGSVTFLSDDLGTIQSIWLMNGLEFSDSLGAC